MFLDTQAIGWIAAASMLATFTCQSLLGIRLFGISANLAFIAYGWQAGLMPVLALHLLLLPINTLSLVRMLRARQRLHSVGGAADAASDAAAGAAAALAADRKAAPARVVLD